MNGGQAELTMVGIDVYKPLFDFWAKRSPEHKTKTLL